MALYRCVGEFTYSSRTQRETCLTQVESAVAGFAAAVGWAGDLPAGVSTSGNTGLRVSFELPDAATAAAFEQAVGTAAAFNVKTASSLSLALVGGS